MQDEVNEKTMALCIKGGKISAQLLKAALTKLLSEIEKKKQQSKKMGGQNRCKRGKQSMQNSGRQPQKNRKFSPGMSAGAAFRRRSTRRMRTGQRSMRN